MATTLSYYEELKAKYDADALAKKQALDEALVRASTAEFDEQGNITGYGYGGGTGPGALDVQQMETERMTKGAAEGAGMLRSGQLARDLATSQAEYRARVIGARESTEAQKRGIESEQQTNIAEAKAMYETPKPKAGTSTATTTKPQTTASSQQRITPPPQYKPTTPAAAKPKPGDLGSQRAAARQKKVAKKPAPRAARGGTTRYR